MRCRPATRATPMLNSSSIRLRRRESVPLGRFQNCNLLEMDHFRRHGVEDESRARRFASMRTWEYRESMARETCPAMLMITSSPAPDSPRDGAFAGMVFQLRAKRRSPMSQECSPRRPFRASVRLDDQPDRTRSGGCVGGSSMHGIESFRESVEDAVIGQIAQNLFVQPTRCRVGPREVLEASFRPSKANSSAGGPPGGYNAIGLRLWATDGSGIALQIFPAGVTRSAMRRAENPATRLITIWPDEKRSPDRTSSATCGRTARTTVSDPSSTSWLEAHTETFSKRLARTAATPALRGDKRMVRRAPPSELRPVTMAVAMAPVPTNPRVIEIFFIVPERSGRRLTLAGLRTPAGCLLSLRGPQSPNLARDDTESPQIEK